MTKYSHLTDEEVLRMWDSLEPLYLLEEVRHRFERALELVGELERRQWRGREEL